MKIFLVFVCLVLASVAYVRNAGSAPYSADLVTVTGGRQSTSKVYVGDSRLRTEVTANSVQIVTIARLDEKVVYVLIPLQKLFVEKPLREEDGLLAYISDQNAQRELVGTETLKGQSCDKYKMRMRDQVFYVWINRSSHIPMMMFSPDDK